jgi:aldehyde dehydrogenase (NAD+)
MAISKEHAGDCLHSQKEFFQAGKTRSYAARKKALKDLRSSIQNHEEAIMSALKADMNKPSFEAYSSEIGIVLQEIGHSLHWLKEWMHPQRVPSPVALAPASSKVIPRPLGQVLILGPWNYPFNLILTPLVAAISAGNTALLKLPWQTPETAKVIDIVVTEALPEEWASCIAIEDQDIIPELIHGQSFQHIFFTGSKRVGKLIYSAAAEHLIPVTLELGGKSPVIVDSTADIGVAARRIIWGKCFNAGQTCIAPDHVWAHESIKAELLKCCQKEAKAFEKAYSDGEGMGRIVNTSRFEALEHLLEGQNAFYTSSKNKETLHFGLHLIDEPAMDSAVMKEEIFGPILPFLSWRDEVELIEKIERNAEPLSFYLFSKDRALEKRITERIAFGGGCLNDCLVHFANGEMPFGGIGNSGMGSYHGKKGFDTFSHYQSWVRNSTWLDVPVRYVPYSGWKNKLIKYLMK